MKQKTAAMCSTFSGSAQRNNLRVLKALRSSEGVSRADLPRRTGLSAGTITAVTSDLIARGLVVEKKAEAVGRGRPRVYLELNAEGGTVVGARLSEKRELQISFVDLAGRERVSTSAALPRPTSLRNFAELIAVQLEQVIAAHMGSAPDIRHVSLSLPALVDSHRGDVHFMTTFDSGPVPFSSIISRRISLPVTVENDSVCQIRAEHWFGRAQEFDDFTLINVGYAVTSARYAGGLLRTGAGGFTPELGHVKTTYGADARVCFCGSHGCATAYSSTVGLVLSPDEWGPGDQPILETVDQRFEALLGAAAAGDQRAAQMMREAGDHLGRLAANHVNASDPGTILILVPDDRYLKLSQEAFQSSLSANTLPALLARTKIEFAVRTPDWHWKGIAALALEDAYSAP